MNKENAESAIKEFLEAMDYPCEGELKETPKRIVNLWAEELSQKPFNFTTFKTKIDHLIVKPNIFFRSRCNHHGEVFYGFASIAYVPNGKLAGLSKLSRIVKYFSNRLQKQEDLTESISNFLVEKLNPKGSLVRIKARHLCECRAGISEGIDDVMITISVKGLFKTNPPMRQEALNEINKTCKM